MNDTLQLTQTQFDLVYNAFSFVIAAMGASLLFFLLMRNRVSVVHQLAVVISTLVVGIALYHYVRIFNSFSDAFTFRDGVFVRSGAPFNEGYRYVDWLLTVPLLLTELVVVLKLAPRTTKSLAVRLSLAAVAMIALGYPGEMSASGSTARLVFGVLGTLPFLYILYVLFGELGRSPGRQEPATRRLLNWMRYVLLVTWSFYPVAYFAPSIISDEGTAFVVRQIGYSIADVLAKPVFGLLVLAIALIKTKADAAVADPDGDVHRELDGLKQA